MHGHNEILSLLRNKGILPFTMTYMNLEDIMLNEIGKT
jgi:hypothetical protein